MVRVEPLQPEGTDDLGSSDAYSQDLYQEGVSRMQEVDLIDIQELKAKLDEGDGFKVVMTLGEWEYRTTHIPGSMRISTIQEALEELDPSDEIVLYDSGPACTASWMAFKILKAHGYERVRRYAGGLEEWADAGYPLEGESIE
jgi:rhodanese-related sulfurtransferase